MKRNLLLLMGIICLFVSPIVCSLTKDPLDNQLQLIVDKFLQDNAAQEQLAGISASIFIPQEKQDHHDVKNFTAGTVGQAPFLNKLTSNDFFEIGRISQSFITVLILQLHTQNKLSLDDPLGKWLPEYTQWTKVTIRELLNMTSGIPNYSSDPAFQKKMNANLNYQWTNKELLAYAHPEKPLHQNQNHLFSYSDSNYLLAALVIEKVTKDNFSHQLAQLFKQANLNNSFYLAGPEAEKIKKEISNRLTHGYYYAKQDKKLMDSFNRNLSWLGAAGAVVATTEDVARWVLLLYRGTLIEARYREDALAAMETIISLKTGHPIPEVNELDSIGFGLGVSAYYDKKSKHTFWLYQGDTLGFRIIYFWNPCNDIVTVVAGNSKTGQEHFDFKLDDPLVQINLKLYQAIVKSHNELQCEV